MSYFRKALISLSVCLVLLSVLAVCASAASGTGVVKGDILNIRKSPNTSAEVLEQLEKGTQVSIISSSDGWYKVSYNGITGWVNGEYITVKQVASKTAKINTNDVNLRESASTDALVLKTFDKGDQVSVISSSGNWYKVRTSNGTVGWVFTDFITIPSTSSTKTQTVSKSKTTSRGAEEENQRDNASQSTASVSQPDKEDNSGAEKDSDTTSDTRQQVVSYAKKFLGVRYVYGGRSPSGFDCSGFTSYVFDHFGVDLERVAADQARQGTKVSKANLRAGDVIFFDTNGGRNYINHAGIYIGDGMFIHASSGSNAHRVVISDLNEGFYSNHYMTARRFFK